MKKRLSSFVIAAALALPWVGCASDSSDPAAQDLQARNVSDRHATFDAENRLDVKIPAGAHHVRVWFPIPREKDQPQAIRNLVIESGGVPTRITEDALGNRCVYVDLIDPKVDAFTLVTRFQVTRTEQRHVVDASATRPLNAAERAYFARWLEPTTNEVMDDQIRQLSHSIVGKETNPVRAARAIYDWVLDNVEYWVKDPANKKASPVGSATYCLSSRTGNCTDFHSLWTSLARAAGIPTRMVYGSFFKASLDGVDKDQSYHCWPEFWAPGIGWIPNDVAVADIFNGPIPMTEKNQPLVTLTTADGYSGPDPAKVDWYFGNLDDRRVAWSMGRDLTMEPRQDAGPVNANPKGYVEVDGKVHTDWTRKLTHREVH